MNQYFMSNRIIRIINNIIFPPAMRNAFMVMIRELWFYINVVQLHIYFTIDEIPFLRWMCPVLEYIDVCTRALWRFIAYIVRLQVWLVLNIARLYGRALRYAIYLFFGYSILAVISNMEIVTNIPMLEVILKNTEWIYQYAGQFIDFNMSIVKKAVDNFCAVPFEQKSTFERTIIEVVNLIVEQANHFVN